MGCFLIVPITAAIAAIALHLSTFLGFFLGGFATVITALAGVVGLVLLW
jgi:hypothetical protein